jgi:hypothetical protein
MEFLSQYANNKNYILGGIHMIVVRKSQIQELEKKRKRSNLNMLLSGILIGASIGAIVALLLAPNEGVETRTKISSGAKSISGRCKALFGGCCCGDDCDQDCCEVTEE